MVYIRIKNIRANNILVPYAYLCKSIWINGTSRQKVIKYLGRVPDLEVINLRSLEFKECCLCGSKEDLTIDHQIPLNKGGSNSINNLQIMCRLCNQKKAENIIITGSMPG